ncbi:hypothetical protein BN946_scf184975.g1 [Trametes cinnabarina]|uniref:DNA 3'-5' helicase n=1 Tax=Pycnoporus cinnabarinus TaxID=5643 RepID=A0A060SQ64_PYCCI|nr:hypothetical protein BN946_scf184975.g1 [Trametes cinnabarina]
MPASSVPSIEDIRQKTAECLGRRPCIWQCRVAQAILERTRDVVCISGTGSGKTLTFWMPLLFRSGGIQVVITPLNILGTQTKVQLERLGISAIAIRGETATSENIEDIITLKYRVVAVSPEVALKHNGIFERVWRSHEFMSHLISVVWDEAHLIKAWASFRKELGEAYRLRNVLTTKVPYLLPSATLPDDVLNNVLDLTRIRKQDVHIVRRSNDRPNVYLTVRKLRHSLSSYKDLEFLAKEVRQARKSGRRIRKFVVFFDSIEESMSACEIFRLWLEGEDQCKVVWYNADNTTNFRENATEKFRGEGLIGLFCTDAFGMGVDIPDIEIVIQWRPTCDLNTLWQRFGRAARDPSKEALAVLLVDAKYFDEEKEAARKRVEKRREAAIARAERTESGKRARGDEGVQQEQQPGGSRKRARPEESRASRDSPRGESGGKDTRTVSKQASETSRLTEYETLRVSYRTGHQKLEANAGGGKKARRADDDGSNVALDMEMDCLVNAATRVFRCYRKPITAFYENDRLSKAISSFRERCPSLITYIIEADEERCMADTGRDCSRCSLPPSTVCCSLCTPSHPLFSMLASIDEPLDKPKASRTSQVDSKYTFNPRDIKLRDGLHALRRENTVRLFGLSHLDELGPGAVMSDEILKRIIDCARVYKLRDIEALYRETKWHRAHELGEAVLRLVHEVYPAPVPLAPVDAALSGREMLDAHQQSSSSKSGPSRIQRRCSACGAFGHIKTNVSCPRYTPRTPIQRAGKENATPSSAPARLTPLSDGSALQFSYGTPARAHAGGSFSPYDTLFGAESPSYRRTVMTAAEVQAMLIGKTINLISI